MFDRMQLLEEVREASAWVAERARWVRIDDDCLGRFAESLPLQDARPSIDLDYYFQGDVTDTIAYVTTFTAVNFGSGWHPHVHKVPGRSGSITMMTRLTERFRAIGPLPAKEMATLTPERAGALFDQPMSPPLDELMSLFARALRDLGTMLLSDYDGSPAALVEDAGHSAEQLAERLLMMPLFRDVAYYDGHRVPFFKRAQIASADLAAVLPDHPLGQFDDLDRLTLFADNLVPHLLHVEGVLQYDPELERRIDAGDLLVSGSPEEIEIRACAVEAVERLVGTLRAKETSVNPAGIGHLLWRTGQRPRYKSSPRHRCRSSYY